MNPPPPIPDDCGSTSPSTSCMVTAASTALPPRFRISKPASTASGCAATAMKRVPTAGSFGVRPVAASGAGCANATAASAQNKKGSPQAALPRRKRTRRRVTSRR